MSLNHDLIRLRCSEIVESCERLEKIAAIPEEEFLQDRDARDIASYRLLIAIEAALSICYHYCSKTLQRVPENYADCFKTLGDEKVVSAELSANLQDMARFRNLLIHVYWQIDERTLYRIITHHLGDLRDFTKAIGKIS